MHVAVSACVRYLADSFKAAGMEKQHLMWLICKMKKKKKEPDPN